jgi:tetratricopeptide (TPR) repeat protein
MGPDATPQALFQQAVAAHQAGDLEGAERLYRAVIAADPKTLAARANLAVAAFQRGDLAGGVAWLDASLAIEPRQAAALSNRAGARAHLGLLEAALADCEAALALDPDLAEALQHKALIHERLDQPAAAVAAYDRLLALDPDNASAAHGRSGMLHRLGRLDDALASVDRAIALAPDLAKAWANRGAFLIQMARDEEGVASLERSVALDAADADAWYNLANGYGRLRRMDEAFAAFDRATALRPDFASAHWNKALALLAAGRTSEGWPLYEWRWRNPGFESAQAVSPAPLWRGEDLAGKTLLLHFEQGFGDTVLMLRYLPLLRARGARLILGVQPALAPLAAPLADRLLADGEAIPPHDVKAFLMSLPLAFGGLAPTQTPYLAPPPGAQARWAARLGPRSRPRIGLVWAGNPGQVNDRNRSLPLERLAPWLEADAEFVALQTEYRPADLAVLRAQPRIRDVSAGLTDFGETAGVIANLDLVIAVDTAVVHLACALGKPAWVLAPYALDFRWGLEGESSPWHPTARVFRQPRSGDWSGVLAAVRTALAGAG